MPSLDLSISKYLSAVSHLISENELENTKKVLVFKKILSSSVVYIFKLKLDRSGIYQKRWLGRKAAKKACRTI